MSMIYFYSMIMMCWFKFVAAVVFKGFWLQA